MDGKVQSTIAKSILYGLSVHHCAKGSATKSTDCTVHGLVSLTL